MAAVSRYALCSFEQLQLLMPFAPFLSQKWTSIFSPRSEQISLRSVDETVLATKGADSTYGAVPKLT